MCHDQYTALITRLRDEGWPTGTSYARYTRMDDRTSCEAGDANPNRLACATLQADPNVRLCATHITPTRQDTKDNGTGPAECGPGGRKLDYLFASENHLTGDHSASVLNISQTCGGPCSDHHAIVGNVTLTP